MNRTICIMICLLTFSISAETTRELLKNEGFYVPEKKIYIEDFELNDIKGNITTLSEEKGKIILLNFWATWCAPCIYEMPSLEALHRNMSREGMKIITISLGERTKTVRRFINRGGYTFQVLLDPENLTGILYGIKSIPTTLIINKEGYIIASYTGARKWDKESLITLFQILINEDQNQRI